MPALNVRLPDELHEVARVAASSRGVSMHQLILDAVREKLLRLGTTDTVVRAALDRAAK